MPPSEALNRADEWSFSLCCVANFSLGGLREHGSSLRDEPATLFCEIDYADNSTFSDYFPSM